MLLEVGMNDYEKAIQLIADTMVRRARARENDGKNEDEAFDEAYEAATDDILEACNRRVHIEFEASAKGLVN